MVFLTVGYNVCSQFKMLQHVLSLARSGVIISPQFFISCTGYTSPPVNSFQDCWLCFPGTDRPSTRLPCRRLPPDIRLGLSQTPLFPLLTLELVSPSPPPWTSMRFGIRSFSAAGPEVWNGLPSALRAPDLTFDRFKRRLKTYLFTLVWWDLGA